MKSKSKKDRYFSKIKRLLMGRLEPEEAERVRLHLNICSHCQSQVLIEGYCKEAVQEFHGLPINPYTEGVNCRQYLNRYIVLGIKAEEGEITGADVDLTTHLSVCDFCGWVVKYLDEFEKVAQGVEGLGPKLI